MTVAELIAELQKMPPNAPVSTDVESKPEKEIDRVIYDVEEVWIS